MNMEARRRGMLKPPAWTIIMTEQQPNTTDGRLKPVTRTITAGQKILIAWEGCSSFSYTARLWGLHDGAAFKETNKTDLDTKNLTRDGERSYTVKTGGRIVFGGLNSSATGGSVNAYLFKGNCIKVRIT